ncbi:hypothetical protein O6H91_12G066500 [Diphasiastrum complanatum]|uniref:Uncharacterized protein n=1 Tax=Diphasiastrum complanatum TaxID=34168 RepID=A0ACC2C2Y7_DIPCM|nr:hypothetical protein O6H91_12G066500 [Diphasiastrum complanatum]
MGCATWTFFSFIWIAVHVQASRLLSDSNSDVGVSSSASLSIFQASDYGQQLQLNNGLARTPPMGWNSWNHFGCAIDEKLMRETTDALISTGLAEVGYNYVNLDDCWAELKRDEQVNQEIFSSHGKYMPILIHNCFLYQLKVPASFRVRWHILSLQFAS